MGDETSIKEETANSDLGSVSSSYIPIKDRHGALYLIPKERQSEFENDFAVRHIGNKKTDKWRDYRCR